MRARDGVPEETVDEPTVAASWQTIFTFSGAAEGHIQEHLPASFDGKTNVYVRFRLTTNGATQGDGVFLDDFAVNCWRASANPPRYAYFNGTSMATAHVAGAATFVATKFPSATVADVRDKLMRSVDKKSALTGKSFSGGRLNLYKAAAESTAAVSAGTLRWTAARGERNVVTVTQFTDTDGVAKYRLTDAYSTSTATQQSGSRITPGAGCTRVNDYTVKCPVAGITRISLTADDQDDTLNASTIAIPVGMSGGDGNDTLIGGTAGDTLSGGLGVDRFTGGTGNDSISARNDDVDGLFSCGENTGDRDVVTADLAPADAVNASPTGCEVVTKA